MNEVFNSIHYPFAIDKNMGVLKEEKDFNAHVKQMMLQVLFTNPGERVNRPDFGCGIRRMVFAPNSDVNASLLQIIITQALDKWLADVITTEKIEVTAVNERLEVKIIYKVKAKQERQFLNVQV